MKKIKFQMCTDQGAVATDGYLVGIFDWIQTVVHRCTNGWRVSELSTGASFMGVVATRSEAIGQAMNILQSMGKDKALAAIAKFVDARTPKAIKPAPVAPVASRGNRVWPKVGQIVQLRYGKQTIAQYQPSYQGRHARVILIASGRPKNCLVMLRGGLKLVTNIGNLFVE